MEQETTEVTVVVPAPEAWQAVAAPVEPPVLAGWQAPLVVAA